MSAANQKNGKRQARSANLLVEQDVQEQSYDLALLRGLWPYLKPHSHILGVALLFMPIASVAAVAQPFLLKSAIDATLVTSSADALENIVLLFFGAIVLQFFARFAQTYLMQLAGQRATAGLRRSVFEHIQRLAVGYLDRTPIGRVVTRVTNDIDGLTELFASGAVTAIADLVTLAGIVCFMLYLDWQLSLVAFAALPPLAVAINIFRGHARKAFRGIRFRIAQLNAYLNEQVQGIAVVQAFSREAECAAEYAEINAAYRQANYDAIRYDALLYSVVQSVSVACVAMVLWFAAARAGWATQASAAEVGTVVAFYDFIQRFFIPIRDLATKYTIIQQSLASAERIFSLLSVDELDADGLREPEGESPADDVAIAFRGVEFGYRPEHPVLRDVSFEIRRGQRVAIVGATGSGKTTVLSLLQRLYELQSGEVWVTGDEVRAVSRAGLRGRFASVPQDVFLFSGTVRDNLALNDDVSDERAIDALERVGAMSFLEERGGLDAEIGERGQGFSAGQRQLLSFARALVRDAPLLLLDEATANVDSESEAELQRAVSEVLAGRTALIVAHRLSTIRDADRILVFHKGRIVEDGDHESLLSAGGVYSRLHRLQFAADPGQAELQDGATIR